MIDFGHVLETVLTTTIPIGLFMWKNRAAAKKETQAKHEENQLVLAEIKNSLDDHPPHHHIEKSGVLQVSGIRPDVL